MGKQYKIGEIYMMEFAGEGSAQKGWRPGLVFQNNMGNEHSPNIVALPLTTSLKKMGQPTHIYVSSKDSGLQRDSMVLCENPECVPKERIGRYVTTLTTKYMTKIAEANLLASSAISYLTKEEILELWQKAITLNKKKVA